MDPSSLQPFIAALRRVFSVAFQMNVDIAPHVSESPILPHADARAAIPLSGDLNATLVLSFPIATAQRLVSLLTGLDVHRQSDNDIADALGEIANMVAGNAKPHFHNLRIRSHQPTVTADDNLAALSLHNNGPAVRCLSDCGEFTLRLVHPRPRATVTLRAISEAVPR